MFGELKKVPLRSIWAHEAQDFTPWLAENIEELGNAVGLELELVQEEASVGNFSLDILAKDLGSAENVIIENQFSQTDHDHLGKLLTYAAGFDASFVIWVAETIREEHRQALDWLNHRTDSQTQFFAVVVEVIQIDESKPAFNLKPVVFPNEWQKSKSSNKSVQKTSAKSEKYREYFQELIDELRCEHKFTSAKAGQPQNWYAFASGITGINYGANFCQGNKVRTELYIDFGNAEQNELCLNYLLESKAEIEDEFGSELSWEPIDGKRATRVAVYRDGSILDESNLSELKLWHINNLIKFKGLFAKRVRQHLK
ncbi:DUF4268 domain-containing protein [Vibrio parahaemolyticus]|uniref:DUF4268 domain-containing protein n=1 Tax=Vibrio parahaemolyticus TaxID=670 RepID=UPI00044892B0|nr:DUF4268 domain-containing protein [Vibrio parahaemolyticus]EHH2514646.1 DUF4268 domain-containing protein [Vibrio parahaemolyticus]ELA9297968.1 DUF4268 domain-containing protein [Vibrio parahaemolyticus]EXJ24707.1 hypothetical protein D048_4676 [Vibrio parahaemolyticus VPTS-2009]